ncbi:hydrogenase [Candidatus Woesearchaeota archaeon]|nr:hydrogenase [Candidatus Woesearchaeota archaeon]
MSSAWLMQTGLEFWNPIVLTVSFILILILVYIIRAIGNKSYDKGTGQTKPFQSGNVDEQEDNVRAADIYWGFTEAFNFLYRPLVRFHTGIVNDYIALFVAVLAIILLIILLL